MRLGVRLGLGKGHFCVFFPNLNFIFLILFNSMVLEIIEVVSVQLLHTGSLVGFFTTINLIPNL